jgi:hypothetical protein
MNFIEALNCVIDDGINAASLDYNKPSQKNKLDGSIRGFEDCRNKNPIELKQLLIEANETSKNKMLKNAHDYWYWRCRTIEIEWVCNVMSCILDANKQPIIANVMTARGMIKAADIIGVKEHKHDF